MKRTDIHRPSAEEFDPQSYEFRGCFDLNPEPGDIFSGPERVAAVNRAIANSYRFASHGNTAHCGHCGAHIRYAALMVHPDSREMIYVGEQCLGNRFSLTQKEFKALRENAALNRDRMRKSEKVAAILADYPSDSPFLAAYAWATNMDEEPHYLAQDIARKLAKYGTPLSEKQEALIVKLYGEEMVRRDRKARYLAAIEAGEVEKAPSGRVTVTGEILSVKHVETDFGGMWKMLVQDLRGFKVWGTCPSSLENTDKGAKVEFSANLQPSQDDPYFAFYTRPTKARNLTA